MDNNLLMLAGLSLVAVVLTYILTKSSADKKIEKFKSLDEALTKTKEEYDSACISRESIIAANATAKRELEKINEETAELQALKGQDDALKLIRTISFGHCVQ